MSQSSTLLEILEAKEWLAATVIASELRDADENERRVLLEGVEREAELQE